MTTTGLPSYDTEGRIYAKYITQAGPEARLLIPVNQLPAEPETERTSVMESVMDEAAMTFVDLSRQLPAIFRSHRGAFNWRSNRGSSTTSVN